MKAGFAEVDITPPVGTLKIGWLKKIVSDKVLDPLCARVAVFEQGGARVAFVQLDTLSIRWSQVREMRSRLERCLTTCWKPEKAPQAMKEMSAVDRMMWSA